MRTKLAALLIGAMMAVALVAPLWTTHGPAQAMTVKPPANEKSTQPCRADPPPTNQGTLTAKPVSPAIGGTCP